MSRLVADLDVYRVERPYLALTRDLRLRVPGSRFDPERGELALPCPLCGGTASLLAAAVAGGDAVSCTEGCDELRIESALRHLAAALPRACDDPDRHRSAGHRSTCPRCLAWSGAAREAYRDVQRGALAVVADPARSSEPSGWADVPLDGLLDAMQAGALALPVPTVGMVSGAGCGLFYSGRVNGLAGESGGGKGWIALAVGVEQMQLGKHVYYLDWEDSPALAVQRLVGVLGADPQLVRQRFHYLHPERHDAEGIAALVRRVAETPGALVVIDSTGESIAGAGLNQNHDEDVASWFQQLAHPLATAGATVVLLDHMTKSEDGGLWPIGSQRKRAAVTGAQYVVEVVEPFSRSVNGAVALRVAKDRHGAREARSVASFVQFTHPIAGTTTTPEGEVVVELAEALTVTLGLGKSAEQLQADRDARAAAQLAADLAELDRLDPPPTSTRDVADRLRWSSRRATPALREWRATRSGGAS